MKEFNILEKIKKLPGVSVRLKLKDGVTYNEARCLDYAVYFVDGKFYGSLNNEMPLLPFIYYPDSPTNTCNPSYVQIESDFDNWSEEQINLLLRVFEWLSKQYVKCRSRIVPEIHQLVYKYGYTGDSCLFEGEKTIPGVSNKVISEVTSLFIDSPDDKEGLGNLLSATNTSTVIYRILKDDLELVLDDLEFELGALESMEALKSYISEIESKGEKVEIYRISCN